MRLWRRVDEDELRSLFEEQMPDDDSPMFFVRADASGYDPESATVWRGDYVKPSELGDLAKSHRLPLGFVCGGIPHLLKMEDQSE